MRHPPRPSDRASGREPDEPHAPVALVTGSTSGLGREVARRLGRRGHHVLVHGRSGDRGAAVVREIEGAGGSARFLHADLASLEEAGELAAAVQAAHDRLDTLVNNAGVYPDERVITEDGHELGFQVNHLAHFLLTLELLPLLQRGAPSRVVNVSSGAQEALDFGDLTLEEGWSGSRSYARSKLAQVLFTLELAPRVADDGIRVNALHPATYMDTRMVRELEVTPRSSVDEGAEAVMRLVEEDVGTGGFFDGTEAARAHPQAYDAEARRRLWEVSEELVGR